MTTNNLNDDNADAEPLDETELDELQALSEKDEDELTDAEVTSKIKLSVKRRYDFPTWVVVFEFQNRDGRRADCLAFNCKASRNFSLVGFEFKASRSDWLSEKRDHDKSDLFVQLCDEWYVVAGRRGIVKEEELPDGWGLLELKPSGRLYNIVESDLNEMQDTELDRRFYTRFMRKAIGNESNFTQADIREAEKRGYERAKDKMVEDHLDRKDKRLRDKAENFDRLKEAGLNVYGSISEERVERLKKAEQLLKQIEADNYGSLQGEIEFLASDAERHLEGIQEVCGELEESLDTIRSELSELADDPSNNTDGDGTTSDDTSTDEVDAGADD